jgi:hypothetical protein
MVRLILAATGSVALDELPDQLLFEVGDGRPRETVLGAPWTGPSAERFAGLAGDFHPVF